MSVVRLASKAGERIAFACRYHMRINRVALTSKIRRTTALVKRIRRVRRVRAPLQSYGMVSPPVEDGTRQAERIAYRANGLRKADLNEQVRE